MKDLIPIGDLPAFASGFNVTNLDFRGLPDEIGGKPAALAAILFDVTLGLNSAAGGAGVTGRNMFDCLSSVFVKTGHPAEKTGRVNNLCGGQLRMIETAMVGVEPPIPANLAAAAGAVTKQLRITCPITDLGADRLKDHVVPVAMLKKSGTFQFTYAASPSALGGNANDTITSMAGQVLAVLVAMDEGEVPQPLIMEWFDKNGATDFTTKADRYRYALVTAQGVVNTGVNLAAGTISPRITSMHVGGSEVMRNVTCRDVVEQFNKDRIQEAASRRVAPDDAALGLSDFFPLLWPGRGQDGVDIPAGELRTVTQGTQTSFRLTVVEVPAQDDAQREEVLIATGYNAGKVKATPAALRRPNLLKPIPGGHLTLPMRKRALISQTWEGLSAEDRKGN